jgi:peptidoglycan/xylan/chitin deacetylase (PgdA/CDA1 family)
LGHVKIVKHRSKLDWVEAKLEVTHSIMFHHFHSDKHLPAQGSLSAESFDEMLNWLSLKYNLLNADDYLLKFEKNHLEPKDICLSFDDALLCQFDVAAPILRKHKIKAFFFVYSSVFTGSPDLLEIFRYFRTNYFKNIDAFYKKFFIIVRSNNKKLYQSAQKVFERLDYLSAFQFYSENDKWFRYLRDQVLGKTNYNSLMLNFIESESFDTKEASKLLWMSEQDLKELHNEGHLIGLHSYSHPTQMSKLSRVQQEEQYWKNMEHLEGIFGKDSIYSMSHPCGDYSSETLNLLSNMGIRIGFRSSLSYTNIRSKLEIPREDQANIHREMKK